jgi:predicted GNAT family N-acyltransferase
MPREHGDDATPQPEVDVQVVRTDDAYEDALAVRFAVFVEEQDVPEEMEVDAHEDESLHFVAYDDAGHDHGSHDHSPEDRDPVGAARLRPLDDEPDAMKVERVAVLPERRGEGIGARLMDVLEDVAHRRGHDRVTLHSQTHAAGFYDRLGYERVGEEFEEAGIPHVAMEKAL